MNKQAIPTDLWYSNTAATIFGYEYKEQNFFTKNVNRKNTETQNVSTKKISILLKIYKMVS